MTNYLNECELFDPSLFAILKSCNTVLMYFVFSPRKVVFRKFLLSLIRIMVLLCPAFTYFEKI